MDNTNSVEAPKDPGIYKPRYTEQDYEGMYIHNIIYIIYILIHIYV